MPMLIPPKTPTTPIVNVNVPGEIYDGGKLNIAINFTGWPKENINMMLVIFCPNGTIREIPRENFLPSNITINNILLSGVGNYMCYAIAKCRDINIISNTKTVSVKYNKSLINDVYLIMMDENIVTDRTKHNNKINYTVVLQPQTHEVNFAIIVKYGDNFVPLREYYNVTQGREQIKEVDGYFKVTINKKLPIIEIKVFEMIVNITFKYS
jgi:hypothetical protein